MKRFVYADNAATTKVSENVLSAMLPYFCENYGNPSSLYAFADKAKRAVEHAREQVAAALHADPKEIYFTSGGSEGDNWAIKGAALMRARQGKKHIISSRFEHHAVLHTLHALEKDGYEVTYIDVGTDGIINAQDIADAIRSDTALVSIMYVNNEIGTIQPIPEIGKICREKGVLFHTDAVQAVGHIEIDVKEQCIDILSLSGHKIHGPKGIGAQYIRKGIILPNLVDGGAQERGKRAGTENVPAIVGLGTAIEEACQNIAEREAKIRILRDRIFDEASKITHSRINGSRDKRIAGNFNMSFEGIEGESLLLLMDMNGICCSSGSACTSGSLDPSHVLLAIGLPHEVAHGSLRLSLNEYNTEEDVDQILEALPKIIQRLRDMSPLWDEIIVKDNKQTEERMKSVCTAKK